MKTPDNATDIKVGHKTPDEVKKGLECCSKSFCTFGCTTECPYFKEPSCGVHLYRDAKELIQFLEGDNEKQRAENAELRKKVEQLQAEQDETEKYLRLGGCETCEHREVETWKEPCIYCIDHDRWKARKGD